MNRKTRERLELFVEKADKLREFGFEHHVRGISLDFHAHRQSDGTWSIELGFPDEKERDAFLLTFRFFHQRNEPISFDRLHNLANDPDLSSHCEDEVTRLRRAYRDYLDGHSEYTVNLFEGQPNRRQMLDVGLYGGLLHANRPKKVQLYKYWTKDSVRAGLFQQEFTKILLRLLDLIYELSDVSRQELQQDTG